MYGLFFSLKKEGNLVICNNTDEPGRYYAKLNKPDTQRQILHSLTYMWNLKKLNSKKQRAERWLPRLGAEGNGKMLVKGYKVSDTQDE